MSPGSGYTSSWSATETAAWTRSSRVPTGPGPTRDTPPPELAERIVELRATLISHGLDARPVTIAAT